MSQPESMILREIGALSRFIQTLNDQEFKKDGLQKGQFIFITRICENAGINLIELTNLLRVDKTTTTKAVQKLIESAFVEKKRDDRDKRIWRLYPTGKALSIYPRIIAEENRNIDGCCCGLTAEERDAAGLLIRTMRENIEAQRKKTGLPSVIRILDYTPAYHEQLIQMILAIQRDEFGIPITILDQPDLGDIGNFYQKSGGFWVAVSGEEVIGSVGIKVIADGNAIIRKMFVRKDWRGRTNRVSGRLLQALFDWARQRAVKKLWLGTTPQFIAAHRFYEKNGFQEVGAEALPKDFPVMAVDKKFYMFDLE
jgi:DNA-binding MarR family transcriptional regulator/GNAT superfamily N-acetyltransferase